MNRKPILEGVRLVAAFEAAKGAIVLLAGLGLLALIHRDLQSVAEGMVRFSHLNPASRYPRIFIDVASHTTNGRLWAMAGGATLYAAVRMIEAYGLWHARRWAEWFAMVAGGLYLPLEIFEMLHRYSWIKVAIFGTNVAIVAYMAYALLHPIEPVPARTPAEDQPTI
jgi:uncharacterized membrane protein (DUF2068 family)